MKKIFLFIVMASTFIFPQKHRIYTSFDDAIRNVYAINLDGSSEFVDMRTNTISIGTSNISILAWVNTTSIVTAQMITALRNSSSGHSIGVYFDSNLLRGIASNPSTNTFPTPTSPSANKWLLVALVINQTLDSCGVFFVDQGVIISNVISKSMNGFDNFDMFYVGRHPQAAVQFYSGLIGEVQLIKDVALSRSEIMNLYNQGIKGFNFPSSYTGGSILAWYKWAGDNNTDFLKDYSSNGKNLTGTNVTQSGDQTSLTGGYK